MCPRPGLAQTGFDARPSVATPGPDRAAILDAARAPAELALQVAVRFQVQRFAVDGDWAFVHAALRDEAGRRLDLSRTPLKERAAHGAASGDYAALLKRQRGAWKVVANAVGPTDVAWETWPAEYGAPASLLADGAPSATVSVVDGPGASPSFDCRKASSYAERAICANPALSREDNALDGLYRRALSGPDAVAARDLARARLRERQACTDLPCVRSWYALRRNELAGSTDVVAGPAPDGPRPGALKPGDCVMTQVASVGSRLEGAPDSGSALDYDNGLHQVSYETVAGMASSRPGDPVRLCLVSRPKHCPAGDARGVIYHAENLRTHQTWTAPDFAACLRGRLTEPTGHPRAAIAHRPAVRPDARQNCRVRPARRHKA